MLTLYYDIDGTILNYDDRVKACLADAKLQRLLEANQISKLVCVSSWTSIFSELPAWQRARGDRVLDGTVTDRIYTELSGNAFSDIEWFRQRNTNQYGNGERRARHLPIGTIGWIYIDDWAKESVSEVHGLDAYRTLETKRVLTCDPYGDGLDTVDFIESSAREQRALISQLP